MSRFRKRVLSVAAGTACFFLLMFASAEIAVPPQAGRETTRDATKNAAEVLELEEFIQRAVRNDTVFEEILIDELEIQYRKDLLLPPGDFVVAVRSDYQFLLIQDQDSPELTFSLSKLFPKLGTEASFEYTTTPEFETREQIFSRQRDRSSSYTALLSQPIAENAFGYVTRVRDKIIGLENEVLTYQIVEAYEDYMASLLALYLDWYEAYENFKVAENSYKENLKLLDNMIERQKNSIALAIDVNKIKLQVLAREETLANSRIRYQNQRNLISTAIRAQEGEEFIPNLPRLYDDLYLNFKEDYESFRLESRTFYVLDLLEAASDLEVKRNANELFPSINLRVGFTSDWTGSGVSKEENILFAGVSFSWPIPDEVERAEYHTSEINQRRTRLTTENAYYRLYANLKNLYEQIERERRLVKIAEDRIGLAESVFADESENYTYGKALINDYIDAFNALDANRFNRVFHLVLQKKLTVETMRLLDQLVRKEEIDHDWSQ